MNILIVEDDDIKREEIIRILNDLGLFNIKETTYKNEALLELINSNNSYDLLILDMTFPLMKNTYPKKDMGLELLESIYHVNRVKKATEKLKILICSSEPKDDYSEYDKVIGSIKYDPFLCLDHDFEEILKKHNLLY